VVLESAAEKVQEAAEREYSEQAASGPEGFAWAGAAQDQTVALNEEAIEALVVVEMVSGRAVVQMER